MVLLDLAVSWGRVGIVGFGGGPAMIPLIKAECVDLRAWQTEDEFLDALALGYTLPGPIATKLSVMVGWKIGGPLGALVALVAVTGPTALAMLLLAGLFYRFQDNRSVAGAMAAVKPVVIGLLVWTVFDLAPSGVKGWQGVALCGAAIVALLLKVHPALVMVGAMVIGAVVMR